MKEYWTMLASLMGALAFLQGVLHAVFPAELRAALARLLGRLTRAFSPYCYFDVTETDGMSNNEIYDAVQLYLSSTAAPASGARLSLTRPHNATSFTFGLAASDRVVDAFRGAARGYLLYGPPGTGKSSMIAAMANFLGYDVYDLELTEVSSNAELRKLLMKTTSKSIIVIEDIDCSVDLTNRAALPPAPKPRSTLDGAIDQDVGAASGRSITLSGLLNFTDGLWSCCGSERIFVFTTNHIEKLDPALLRSGRMDMHVFMSYCTFPALKILLKNYLCLEDSADDGAEVMRGLEEWIEAAEITPADVSEVLIKNRRNGKERAMEELLEVLKARAEKRRLDGGKVAAAAAPRDNDEEEEEKRALESPKEGKGPAGKNSCGDGQDEETDAKKQL
uniref:Putative mitochondrial chaperone BCS1-B n=1 Tax=Aegilops tauschii TaxID=37682 RepID=N1QSC9_AEGTA